jgi:uracil-DNA glycosylase family 4
VNIRDEAVLRELNLYPLWVRREMPAPEVEAEEVGRDLSRDASVERAEVVGRVSTRQESSDAEGAVGLKPDLPAAVASAAVVPETLTPSPSPACGGGEQMVAAVSWPELKQQVHDCTACALRAGCTQTVFGVGDEQAEWLFVGEGPGADEDARGEPFVGQAGKLLDNMLASIKLKRGNNVYIANIVKCRPTNNRTPEADEVATCLPYLQQQIALIKPKLIVALGKTAATALLGHDATLGSLRGTLHDYHGIPLIVTFHPAYLLRSPAEKAKAWQDLCFAVQRMTV